MSGSVTAQFARVLAASEAALIAPFFHPQSKGSTTMDEARLIEIETAIDTADARAAAAIAVAAIIRIGELGRDAGDAFAESVPEVDDECFSYFSEGCAQIEDHLD